MVLKEARFLLIQGSLVALGANWLFIWGLI